MRILTSEQSARVIGGASTVTNSTLAADQLDDVQIDDQDSHGVVSKLHDNQLPLGAEPGMPMKTGQLPPDTHLSPLPSKSAGYR
jgi:hypothetical protein